MFYSVFSCVFFVLLYSFFFFFSSDTPLNKAFLFDIVLLLGSIVSMSVLIAACMNFPLAMVGRFWRKWCLSMQAERLLVCVALFFGFVLLVENWTYSVFGFGLKTNESWWFKILLGLVSLFLSYQFSSFFVWIGKRLAKNKIIVLPVLISITVLFGAYSVFMGINSANQREPAGIISHKYNVLILISDGVDASEMSVYGSKYDTTPFLKTIQSESMVFENAYTNNQNSTGSITSLLTGMSPMTTKVVYPPDILNGINSRRSLPRTLGEYGYYRALWGVPHYVDADSQNMLGAFISNNTRSNTSQRSSDSSERSITNYLSNYLELPSLQIWFFRSLWKNHTGVLADLFFIKELGNPFAQVSEDQTNEPRKSLTDRQRVLSLLADIDEASSNETPFFVLTHLMKTHGSKYRPNNRVFSAHLEETEKWMEEFYRDSILDFDQTVKQVYIKLQETNQLENTIFIIGSDHGAKWSNNKRVPLIIRLPNSSNTGRYNVNVQLIDVAPTVLNALGLPKSTWMEGNSLVKPDQVPVDRFILSAGVYGNRLTDRGVWVRDASGRSEFENGNKFSVVYCDFFMKSEYPLDFSPEILPDRIGDSGCDETPKHTIAEAAERLVTEKIVSSENLNR